MQSTSFFLSEQMTRAGIPFENGKQFESAFCPHDIWLEGEGSFPGGSVVKNLPANVGDKRHEFDPWVRKIPFRKKWQPTAVFLPGKSHGQEEPGELQSIGLQRVGHN